MDSADFNLLRSALEKQGTMIGKQQLDMQVINQNFLQLAGSLDAVSQQLQELQQTAPSAPSSGSDNPALRAVSASHTLEPCLPPPEHYSGDPGTCRSFLSQCSLVFELQPATFPSDRAKVAYVITLLSGKAREWGTAVWDTNSLVCASFSSFSMEMKKVFDRSLSGREAAREILHITQNNHMVSDYAIEFRTLAATCNWDTQALFDVFYHGLSARIKDELATHNLPDNLDSLIELACRVDGHLRVRSWERGNLHPPRSCYSTFVLNASCAFSSCFRGERGTHAAGSYQDLCRGEETATHH
ncbi:hypothetical protein LDENG_00174840 [Lucifuga dentata]|nr:hypothetical protein LDENG_00174840 [Lucifuga dentata]